MKKLVLAIIAVFLLTFPSGAAEKSDEQKLAEELSKLHQLLFGQTIEISSAHSFGPTIESNWQKLEIATVHHFKSVQKQVKEKLPSCKPIVVNTQSTLATGDSLDTVYLKSWVGCAELYNNVPSQ